MKKYLLAFVGIILFSIGCYKDTDSTPPPKIIIETTKVLINTSISGSVLDSNNDLISDYFLKVNGQMHPVQEDHFLLQLEDIRKKGQTIHVIKDGKQIGIKTQLLVENDINQIEILKHPEYEQEVLSKSSPTIDISKSLSADFSSTQWNGTYTGKITIDFVEIEASNSLTPVGYNAVSDLLAVDSRGGFYLQAKTENGEDLLADGAFPILIKTADLDEDINSLFVFNAEDEIWILVAELTSGDEVAVLGAGYYAFANSTPGVIVEGVVKKEEKAVAYQPIHWYLESMTNPLYATESGKWIALLPEQETVTINLLNPCKDLLQTETLVTEADDLRNQNLIILDNDNYQLLDMTIVDCNGDAVTVPSLTVSNGLYSVQYPFSENYPQRWIAVCENFGIAAVNRITGEPGPELAWSTDIDGGLGVLTDCNDFVQGYSFIKIREDEKIYSAFELKIEGSKTIFQSPDGKVKFIFKGMQVGMYNVEEVNVLINDKDFGEKGYYIKCENSAFGCGINHFDVTHYGSGDGSMVRVSFSGTMWMQTLSPSVAGNFDVEGVIVIKN